MVNDLEPTAAWRQRAAAELAGLRERLDRLQIFMHADAFQALPAADQSWLRIQHFHMNGYQHALAQRMGQVDD